MEADGGSEVEDDEDTDGKTIMKIVYIADVDVMFNAFLSIRARPDALQDVTYKFENVTFLLNVVDYLLSIVKYC